MANVAEDSKGFFIVDTLIGTALLTAAAALWFFLGAAVQQQEQRAQHFVAIFLAQGYLNEMEYTLTQNDEKIKIPHKSFGENKNAGEITASEKVNYNGCDFQVHRRVQAAAEHSYFISVSVEWYYHGEMQMEVQERTICIVDTKQNV